MVDHPCIGVYVQHRLLGLYDIYHLSGQANEFPSAFRTDGRCERHRSLLGLPPTRQSAPALFEEVDDLFARWGNEAERLLAFPGPASRALIHWLDAVGLGSGRIRGFAAISHNVASRKDYFPAGASARVIHHPSDVTTCPDGLPEGKHQAGLPGRNHHAGRLQESHHDRPYVFTLSRLEPSKRIDLLIKAFRRVDTDLPFLIAGSGPDEERLKDLARGDPRIRFLGRVPDGDLARAYRESLFVAYAPYDEDYGLITVEAMQAGRAVLTTTDAGGVHEFVMHGRSGLCVVPDEAALADAMQSLCDHRAQTLAMGEAARPLVAHVTWEHTVEGLLDLMGDQGAQDDQGCQGDQGAQVSGPFRRRKTDARLARGALIVSPFPVWPVASGGQVRNFQLARALSTRMPVQILSLSVDPCTTRERTLLPGVQETLIAQSQSLRLHFESIHQCLQVDCSDLALLDGALLDPSYLGHLRREVDTHDVVVCSHPYLYPAVRAVTRSPPVYDAHNVECDMKQMVLGPAMQSQSASRRDLALSLAERLHTEEAALYRHASVVSVCSAADLQRFAEVYGPRAASCAIVPNGVDTQAVAFATLEDKRRWQRRTRLASAGELVLFAASWHGPNIEAMACVVEAAQRYPQLPFVVFGSIGLHAVCQNLPPNVRALGVVSDAEKTVLLQAGTLALNPVRSGSGTNLKVLEYAASGGTIVTTVWGNRGIGLVDGVHCVMTACGQFSEGIGRALALGLEERQRMAGAARCLMEDRFEWRHIGATFGNCVEKSVPVTSRGG